MTVKVMLCPFHEENTPSFCVYEKKGTFYCFSCGAEGDIAGLSKQSRENITDMNEISPFFRSMKQIYLCKCKFCEDPQYTCIIYKEEGVYYCLSCGLKGGVDVLLEQNKNIEFFSHVEKHDNDLYAIIIDENENIIKELKIIFD